MTILLISTRCLCLAYIHALRAARIELAACRKICRIRHKSLNRCKSVSINCKIRNGTEKSHCIRMMLFTVEYTPFYKALTEEKYKEVSRRLTSFEYDSVIREALKLGLNGFMQEKSSAREEYTPSFNLEGVPRL